MTSKQKPFEQAPDPKLIPEMLSTHDVAKIVKSNLHREEHAKATRRSVRRRRLASRASIERGTAVGVGVGVALAF